jgi:hypothetical protein
MAYIFMRPKKSKVFWQARYLDQNGKRVERSTKCKEETKAQEVANGWELMARALREELIPKSQFKHVMKAMYHITMGEQWKVPKIDEFLDDFTAEARISLSKKTAMNREDAVKQFKAFLKERSRRE